VEAVRAATDGDAVRLAELAGQMVAAMSGQRGAAQVAPSGWGDPLPDHLAPWLPSSATDGHLAWMGSIGGQPCGFALAHVDEWDGQWRGVLDALFVEPDARGVGLGRLLLEACLEWMSAQGCAGVDGVAFPGDRSAKNFYEGAGFKARLLTMFRPLS
jgi:GNAT superfamily N-acetyltransferase